MYMYIKILLVKKQGNYQQNEKLGAITSTTMKKISVSIYTFV